MTAAIKRMLADQAKVEAARLAVASSDPIDDLMSIIDRAAPFLDEGNADPKAWPPSAKLKLGFFILGTDGNGRWAGVSYVERLLDRARRRWMDGFYADPFADEPRRRPDLAERRA